MERAVVPYVPRVMLPCFAFRTIQKKLHKLIRHLNRLWTLARRNQNVLPNPEFSPKFQTREVRTGQGFGSVFI
jgi:hypothetical protein